MGFSKRSSPFRAANHGVRVAIRLTPKAARERIHGVVADADGAAALKVAVTAAPEAGHANLALIALLAKSWRVPKSSLTLVSGAADRRKLIELAGDPKALLARLEAWRDGRPG
jgi:uncharacterized protein